MTDNPINPLLSLYLAQTVWGLLYAILIHWMAVNRYGNGGTAASVVVGVAVTLLIQWAFMPDSQIPITFGSFACSGFWMFTTYMYRYERRKKSHKARRLPNNAMRIRDEVVMDLGLLADDTAQGDQTNASIVHRLHQAIAALKAM